MSEINLKAMRRLTVTIPEEYVAGLEDMAEDMGASVSEAVREAVATYLMENYWKETIGGVAREALRRDGEKVPTDREARSNR